jgi:hypothetical protein
MSINFSKTMKAHLINRQDFPQFGPHWRFRRHSGFSSGQH